MDAKEAYNSAKYGIKGHWPEGEKIIAKDAQYAYHYAKDVVKGSWQGYEP